MKTNSINITENIFMEKLQTNLLERAKFKADKSHLESLIKSSLIAAGYQLSAEKSIDKPYIVRITTITAEDLDTAVFSFKVSYKKPEEGDDIGNFAIGCTFGNFEGEEDCRVDLFDESKYLTRVVEILRQDYNLALSRDYAAAGISIIFSTIKEFLEISKTEDAVTSLDVPGLISFSVVYNTESKDYKYTAVANQELKKRIKADDMLESAKNAN